MGKYMDILRAQNQFLETLKELSKPSKGSKVENWGPSAENLINGVFIEKAELSKPSKPSKGVGEGALDSLDSAFKSLRNAFFVPFDEPHHLTHYDPNLGYAQKLPYIQTPAFNTEIHQARSFLKDLYLRGVDIEITPERGLQLVPMPNHPTRADLKVVARLQHGIREQISNPIDLFSQESQDNAKVALRLDDRHSCNECLNLTAMNTCRQVTKGGQFVAWLDAGAVDQPHRCDRFRVKAVKH